MGILSGIARLLIEEHQRRPFQGRLLQLGRQEIMFSRKRCAQLIKETGLVPSDRSTYRESSNEEISDTEFFSLFGVDSIEALDATADVAASVVHDLNVAEVPEQYRGKFDVIFDGGTMEHVFHAPNMLTAIHNLLAPGGRIIHNTPASNAVDHGFYSFSPCLYYEYYSKSGYELNTAYLIDYGTRLLPIRMTAYPYLPPLSRSALDGRLGGHVHYNYVVATKREGAQAGQIPQQSFYQDIWDEAAAGSGTPTTKPAVDLTASLKNTVKSSPFLNRIVRTYGHPVIRYLDRRQARRYLRARGRRLY